jgi:ATP dependent DNA ligase C terminal region
MSALFDQAALKSLYGTMQPLRTDKKPFDQKVKYENATTWLIPKLVGEVKFTEWTSEAEMRHPVFLFHLGPHPYRQFQKRWQSRSRHTQGRNAHFMLGMKIYQTRVTDTSMRRLRAAAQQRYGAVVTLSFRGDRSGGVRVKSSAGSTCVAPSMLVG